MYCREIHSVAPFEIGIAILQSVSEWQHDKVDWSGKNADFFDFNWLPWQRPLKNQKSSIVLSSPFTVYQFEILVKIGPLASEPVGLRRRPLKKFKKQRKNIGKIYSPSGKFAERPK